MLNVDGMAVVLERLLPRFRRATSQIHGWEARWRRIEKRKETLQLTHSEKEQSVEQWSQLDSSS